MKCHTDPDIILVSDINTPFLYLVITIIVYMCA